MRLAYRETLDMCIQRRKANEDTEEDICNARRGAWEETKLWFWTSSLQNEEINRFLNHPVSSIFVTITLADEYS